MRQYSNQAHFPRLRGACLLLAACMLAGCASTSGSGGFPDQGRATPRGGTFVDLDDLRPLAPGMNKGQLQALLGTPHFGEGMWGVRRWDYLFNLSRHGGEPLVCQLAIDFDRDRATVYTWSAQACSDLLAPSAPPAPPVPAPVPLPLAAPIRLSADALFAFDSADLSPSGASAVDGLLAQVRSASDVQDILVVGHADRIGNADYNMALSLRRAQAVVSRLVAGGVPHTAIGAEGRGQREPVANCDQRDRRALIECLAPDRRVEISGTARR